MNTYILDENKKVVVEPDMEKWGRWFGSTNRRVDLTVISEVPHIYVSTVFIGTDFDILHEEDSRPLVFETMIFGSELDQKKLRSRSWSEAEEAHKLMCEKAKTEYENSKNEKWDDPMKGTW